jgi:hypothetical protein
MDRRLEDHEALTEHVERSVSAACSNMESRRAPMAFSKIIAIMGMMCGAAVCIPVSATAQDLRYKRHKSLGAIDRCHLSAVREGQANAFSDALASAEQKRAAIAGPGTTIDPEAWTAEIEAEYGPATAVLVPKEACPYQRILAYSTNRSGVDPIAVSQAGYAIQLACLRTEDRQRANQLFEQRPGPTGKTILIGLSPKAMEGTFQAIGGYEWDEARKIARSVKETPECVRVH